MNMCVVIYCFSIEKCISNKNHSFLVKLKRLFIFGDFPEFFR